MFLSTNVDKNHSKRVFDCHLSLSKTLILSTNVDQISLETEFSIENTVSSDFGSAFVDC